MCSGDFDAWTRSGEQPENGRFSGLEGNKLKSLRLTVENNSPPGRQPLLSGVAKICLLFWLALPLAAQTPENWAWQSQWPVRHLTVGPQGLLLAGSDRRATCAVAEWVSNQVLDDGSRPAGVRYTSKHGGDLPCWAVWVDLGGVNTHKDVGEIIAAHAREYSRSPIELSDSDFLWAARSLGLTAH